MVSDDDLIIEDLLFEAISRAQKEGEISASKNPMALARFICNSVTGMRVYAKFRSDKQYFNDIIATAMSLL